VTPRARPALDGARVAYGALLLLLPTATLRVEPADRVGVGVARLLGARHVAQGLGAALVPRVITGRRRALVDGLHAASMIGWAGLDPRHRRPALLSAASAGVLVVAESLTARRHAIAH
jgi:hypothetical protein